MQKTGLKYFIAVWAILAVTSCLCTARPANAVTFLFSGTCDAVCQVFGFGASGSAVSGELVLQDSTLSSGPIFNNIDVVSLSLTFELQNLNYVPAFFDSNMLDGPVGIFTSAAAIAIEQIDITDSLGQVFAVNLGLEGSFLWSAKGTNGARARGTPVSFDIAPDPVAVPEPGSVAMFLFALGSMVFLMRRRVPVLSANNRTHYALRRDRSRH